MFWLTGYYSLQGFAFACVPVANSGGIRESAGALRPMRRKCCVLVDKGKQTEILNTEIQRRILNAEIKTEIK